MLKTKKQSLAAGVPIVFAINKVDKPHANPDKIVEAMAAMTILDYYLLDRMTQL